MNSSKAVFKKSNSVVTTEEAYRHFQPPLITLLDVQQIARLLKVKPNTVSHWVSHGKIPYLRIGGVLRFDPKDISRWLEEKKLGYQDVRNVA